MEQVPDVTEDEAKVMRDAYLRWVAQLGDSIGEAIRDGRSPILQKALRQAIWNEMRKVVD